MACHHYVCIDFVTLFPKFNKTCYLKRAENEPDRFRIINSGLPLQKVEDEITAILRKLEC